MAECPLTELPEEMCACRHHRGGKSPAQEASSERAQRVAAATPHFEPRVFAAKFPGRCLAECGHDIEVDQMIVGAAGVGYIHVECESEDQ